MSRSRLDSFLSDWPAKILCLAIAIGLFFFYRLNRLEERSLSVPLSVIVNDEYVPASQYPRTVRLVLRGESNAIYAVLEDDLSATIDLSGYASAGVWRVPVAVEKSGSALDIDPLEISVEPSDVSVSLEERIVKEVQVVPSFRGYLDAGYELSGFKLEPSRIEIAGPASLMEDMGDAETEPIELTGRHDNFTLRVHVAAGDPKISFLSADSFEFSAEVRKAVVFRTFQDLPVDFSELSSGLAVRTAAPLGQARVSAASTELDAFVAEAGTLSADLSQIDRPGVYTIAVVPRFPEGFTVESWLPMVVTVSIERAPQGGGADKSEVLP